MDAFNPLFKSPPHLAKPSAVIFDLDGTLIDSESVVRDCWQESMRHFGYELENQLHQQLLGRRLRDVDHILFEHFGSQLPISEIRERVKVQYETRVRAGDVNLKPGVLEVISLVDTLNIKRAVATSTGFERALYMLSLLGLNFDVLVGGDQIRNGKPAPDIYLESAKRLSVMPADCWAIEDSHHGMTSAVAAGMTAIMVPDLLPAHPDHKIVAQSLHEVHDWLTQYSQ
jgi:HAD superfamily hydrolase (TIGR01509 family)